MNITNVIKNMTKEEREELYNKALKDREVAKNEYNGMPRNVSFYYKNKKIVELAMNNYYVREREYLKGAQKYLYTAIVLLGSDEEFSRQLEITNSDSEKISQYTGINANYVILRKLIYKLNQASKTNDNSNQFTIK